MVVLGCGGTAPPRCRGRVVVVRVAATIVYVADVPAALRFYARAFGLEAGFRAPEDVPAALARALDAGAEPVQEPVLKPWGQTVAYVRAPDGVLIELGTPVA